MPTQRVALAYADAVAHHEDEAKEAEAAVEDAENQEEAADERELGPTEPEEEVANEDADSDHDPGTEACFSSD